VQRSLALILTTHTGSLSRPERLVQLLFARESGQPVDAAALEAEVRAAVDEVVARQVEAGINVVNDGEMGKIGYSTYVKERLTGFGGAQTMAQDSTIMLFDLVEYPNFARRMTSNPRRDRVQAARMYRPDRRCRSRGRPA
jgi:5-methyltetrahydropteroyltriglutamate--homocysteine methyltransferase